MNTKTFNDAFASFLDQAPTPFHAVTVITEELSTNQFTQLDEGKLWKIQPGKGYFCIRNGSLVAFKCGKDAELSDGFRIIGTHTDSPSLQLKPKTKNNTAPYLVCGVEKYGGALLSTWFDRDLSLAGRVSYSTTGNIHKNTLIDFRRPILYIPSLAIHLNRSANDGHELNPQTHLSPVLAQSVNEELPDITTILLEQLSQECPQEQPSHVNGFELFCYDPSKASYLGLHKEFLAAPRLDNLISCFAGLQTIIQAGEQTNTMLICSNHEEIGSRSNSGALGNFVHSIHSRLFDDNQEKFINLHNSFLLSLDNAHASHPNYQDSSDQDHQVILNRGPVIKINAAQRYSTNGITSSVLRILAREIGIDCQDFVMRSDMPCGSTIGPLTSAQLGIAAVDIGIPTWGMHAIREVTGKRDPTDLFTLACHFINKKELPTFND